MTYRFEIYGLETQGYKVLDTQQNITTYLDLGGVQSLANLGLLNPYSIGTAPLISPTISQLSPSLVGGITLSQGGASLVDLGNPYQTPLTLANGTYLPPSNDLQPNGDILVHNPDGSLAMTQPQSNGLFGGFFNGLTLEKLGYGAIILGGLMIANNLTKK